MLKYLGIYWFEILCTVWIVALLGATWFWIFRAEKKPKLDKLLVIMFFVNMVTFAPVIIRADGAYALLSAAIYVLRIFAMEFEFGELLNSVKQISGFLPYHILTAVLYLLSPAFTGAFILSFIKNKYKSLQISVSLKKKMHIFTELNESSLALAKSIDKSDSRIIFLDSSADEDTALKEECNNNGFMLIDYTAESVFDKVNKHLLNCTKSPGKEATVFFIDKDENKALDKMIKFIENKIENKEVIKTNIFLFSVSDEAELIVDNYKIKLNTKGEDASVTLRLIDSAQLISYQMLENCPMYTIDSDMLTKGFDVTVIGMGNVGTHIAKDVLWCGQTQNRELRLNMVDIMTAGAIQSGFEYKFPELTAKNYNIRYYSADACSTDFDTLLATELSESNYFVVALGDDETNIMTAHNIRIKYFRYHKKLPMIVAVVNDNDKYYAIQDVFQKLRISVVGMNKDIYSIMSVFSNPVYKKAYLTDVAYNRHKGYSQQSFASFLNSSEGIIRSNIAYAIHIDYKIWDFTGKNPVEAKDDPLEIIKLFDSMSEDDKHRLDVFEHDRWMAYQRSEGWVSPFDNADITRNAMQSFKELNAFYAAEGVDYEQNSNPDKVKLHQSMFAKLHGCIVDYESLRLLAEVMKKNPDEKTDYERFTDYDTVLNEEMLNIWLEYIESKENSDV